MALRLVTIFGGSGFIGRQVVRQLAKTRVQIRVAVRDPAGALFLKTMGDVGTITPIRADVRNEALVRAAIGEADAVVNLVGILHEGGRQRFDAVQHEGAGLVARAAKEAGAGRLVHLSALGASKQSPSRYARTKALGEEVVARAFPEAVILRPSVVFGPQDGFFSRFAGLAQTTPVLPLFGCRPPRWQDGRLDLCPGGGTKFQPVYVGDVADAVVAGLLDRRTDGRIYELGGPTVYSFREVMQLVLRQTRRRRLLLPVPFPLASLAAFIAELLPTPPLTRDQVKLLKRDNIVSGEHPTLVDLGIRPTAAELILPTYLDMYRRGGRFTTPVPD